ncbi:MAG TPA: diacylglycerol kinase [Pirellulales bacterium]|jgi:diacylglycerol kinase
MAQRSPRPKASWITKFRCTFRGAKIAVRGESSFFVHLFVAVAVIVAAAVFQVSLVEWCLLAGCIAGVLAVELLNTAIERLARAVDDSFNEQLRDALDISGAAVLIASLAATLIGALILGSHLLSSLGW